MTVPNQNHNQLPDLEGEGRLALANELAAVAIWASQLTQDFSAVQRIPRYADGRRENDVEHSYMLALAAPEMAHMLGKT